MLKVNIVLLSLFLVLGFTKKSDKFEIGLFIDENVSEETVNIVILKLEGYYNSKVHLIKQIDFPAEFKKDTINAMKLIDYVQKELSLSYQKNIYLTTRGIALNDNAKYSVRGLAGIGKSMGVVSNLVVKNETTTKEQYYNLLAKVLIHEMGHLLGLKHCVDDDKCVMVSSLPNPDLFYNAKEILCASCLEKIDKKLISNK